MLDNRYEEFFKELGHIYKEWELRNKKIIDFNIFIILRNERDEVNLHSKFIEEILKIKNYGVK